MNKQTIIPRIDDIRDRWDLFLQDFSFKIKHRGSTHMQHVDASRNYEFPNKKQLSDEKVSLLKITITYGRLKIKIRQ